MAKTNKLSGFNEVMPPDACICPVCGDRKEDPGRPFCYACRLAGVISELRWYQKAEKYKIDADFSQGNTLQRNATCLPRTGIPWLDQKTIKICEIDISPSDLRQMRHEESKGGRLH